MHPLANFSVLIQLSISHRQPTPPPRSDVQGSPVLQAKHMKDRGIFDAYTQAYGVPDIPDASAFDENDEENEILAAMNRTEGCLY